MLPADCIPEPWRCGGDLTSATVSRFGGDYRVIAAQRTVYEVLETGAARFGIYRSDPQPSVQALADVRAAAGYLLAYTTPADIDQIVGVGRPGRSAPDGAIEGFWDGPLRRGDLRFRCRRNVFRTKAGLAAAVDNRMYFYNHERRHSAPGMRSPIDYEHTLKATTEAS
ncbi:MAG TPA: hypothetical protein VN306_12420 [Mycobacterium sp.]|nr:hypothetical protein [Mycobacterium sp.]